MGPGRATAIIVSSREEWGTHFNAFRIEWRLDTNIDIAFIVHGVYNQLHTFHATITNALYIAIDIGATSTTRSVITWFRSLHRKCFLCWCLLIEKRQSLVSVNKTLLSHSFKTSIHMEFEGRKLLVESGINLA